jgi:3',5'-cyclic AMP phosphodiesterase CpdA
MPLSFVHCSDIHLLSLEGVSPLRFLNKRMTGGVNLLLKRRKGHDGRLFDAICRHARELGVDRLVVTGDVTNLALESEFDLVKSKLDGAGLPVTVIPGNHDTYTRGSARVRRFEHYMSAHMQGERLDGEPYPFVQTHEEVALIGLSTAVPTRPMSAVGVVGPEQLARLARVLEAQAKAGRTRVVLIHHPVGAGVSHAGHELLDLEDFGAVIARHGAELILHGHEHVQLDYELEGPEGPVPVHGVASGTSRSARPGREAAFRVYRFANGAFTREDWRVRGDDFCRVSAAA